MRHNVTLELVFQLGSQCMEFFTHRFHLLVRNIGLMKMVVFSQCSKGRQVQP